MLRLSNIILEMIAKGVDVQATLDRLCVEVAERAPGAICAVFEVDEEGLLRLLSAPELPEPYRTAIDGLPYESDVGSIGSAACLPRPLPSIDVAGEPHCAALSGVSLPPGLNACWSTPIIGEAGRTTGALALFCREPCTQTEDVRTIGQECAHLCAIALERHERFLEHERLGVSVPLSPKVTVYRMAENGYLSILPFGKHMISGDFLIQPAFCPFWFTSQA